MNDLWTYKSGRWTWIAGSQYPTTKSYYVTKAVHGKDNVPSGRAYSSSWVNRDGAFCIRGGKGFDEDSKTGRLNDIWCWNNNGWAYLSGSLYADTRGNWEKQGVASSTTFPSARLQAATWYDKNDDVLYVFGGDGYDAVNAFPSM